jgi:hypothetical protein
MRKDGSISRGLETQQPDCLIGGRFLLYVPTLATEDQGLTEEFRYGRDPRYILRTEAIESKF